MVRAKILSVAAFIGLASVASQGRATPLSANIGVLTKLWAYSTFGSGDVWFLGSTQAGLCQAFWVRGTDPGSEKLYALLLTARTVGRPIHVYAQDDELWSGSAMPSCRVEAIDFAD